MASENGTSEGFDGNEANATNVGREFTVPALFIAWRTNVNIVPTVDPTGN